MRLKKGDHIIDWEGDEAVVTEHVDRIPVIKYLNGTAAGHKIPLTDESKVSLCRNTLILQRVSNV